MPSGQSLFMGSSVSCWLKLVGHVAGGRSGSQLSSPDVGTFICGLIKDNKSVFSPFVSVFQPDEPRLDGGRRSLVPNQKLSVRLTESALPVRKISGVPPTHFSR